MLALILLGCVVVIAYGALSFAVLVVVGASIGSLALVAWAVGRVHRRYAARRFARDGATVRVVRMRSGARR